MWFWQSNEKIFHVARLRFAVRLNNPEALFTVIRKRGAGISSIGSLEIIPVTVEIHKDSQSSPNLRWILIIASNN